MKPRVLVVGEDGVFNDTANFVISRDYIHSLCAAGFSPMMALDVHASEAYTAIFDALLLTGGPDIHCWRYGDVYAEASHIRPMSRSRDELDFALCESFLAAGKPVFGIGRGLQVINVALGGTLYQDIGRDLALSHPGAGSAGDAVTHRAEPGFHSLHFTPGSRLAALFGPTAEVNSCHHQAVKTLGRGLIAAAHAPDGIIEAVEHESLPVFALQWHPEREEADRRPFDLFAALCREVSA